MAGVDWQIPEAPPHPGILVRASTAGGCFTKSPTAQDMDEPILVRAFSAPPAVRCVEWCQPLPTVDAEQQSLQSPPTSNEAHDQVRDQVANCPVCLDNLDKQQLGVCLGANGFRSCPHYFHIDCLRRVEGRRCPICRIPFYKRMPLPSIQENPRSWASFVSLSGQVPLTRHEVLIALDAMLPVPSHDVSLLLESSWAEWSQGEELLNLDSICRMCATVAPLMPPASARNPSSSSTFAQDAVFEDGHRSSGVICKCGHIHVRRGDRVRRGPCSSDVDRCEVSEGELGTIVRIGPGQESVFVKWDRNAHMYCYTWPDPDGQVIAPSSFCEIAEDVLRLQEKTSLSSVAVSHLLRENKYNIDDAARACEERPDEMCEDVLRESLQPFHRIRIVPDRILVQQWFDSCPPCECSNPRCTGGIRWSSNAEKHLGREGYLLKIDDRDDSVLVCTDGPCTCKLWYPRLAVEPAFDPDLADEPLYDVGSRVQCKMEDGWQSGAVTKVLWRGATRTGPHPFEVSLDSGNAIIVPSPNLIRAER